MEKKAIQDMYLAAALLAYGFDYLGNDSSDPSRQKFLFKDGEKDVWLGSGDYVIASISEVEKYYTIGQLMYPPNYPECLKRIKFIVHSGKDYAQSKSKRASREWGGVGGDEMSPDDFPVGLG